MEKRKLTPEHKAKIKKSLERFWSKIKHKEQTTISEIESSLDMIQSKIGNLDEIKKTQEIIDFLNERLTSKKYTTLTADWLSRIAMKLSVLNINIGSMASEAMLAANMSYAYRKFQYAKDWNPTKKRLNELSKATIQDIDSDIVGRNWANEKIELENKCFADRLIILNKGIDSLLMAIGHRLKMLHQERTINKYQEG